MAKKIALHVDALVALALVFVVSFGFNLYQRVQYQSLLTEHVQLQWKAQDAEINWKVASGQLKKCRAAAVKSPAPAAIQ